MNKNEKIILSIINILLCSIMFLGLIFILKNLELYAKIISLVAVGIFTIGSIVMFFLGKSKLGKSMFMINVMFFIILVSLFILNISGVFESLSDVEHVKTLIINSGAWGVMICFLIQIFQVVILPAPGWVFILAISSIYGPWNSFIISCLGIIAGSMICFLIGKVFGKNAVIWCVGKEDTEKYSDLLSKKGSLPFIIMQLLPFFPDDILCMVAGLSSMKWKFFTIVMLIVKPITIGLICLFGNGNVIPFSGWGIFAWIIIFIIISIICFLYFKNQDKVDNWIRKKLRIKNDSMKC